MTTKSLAIFCFYNIANGPQACLGFSADIKHCNVIIYDGKHWIVVDMDATGILTRGIRVTHAGRFMEALKSITTLSAMISVEIRDKKKVSWKPFLIRSCNEICRYATGIDVGLTFNPRHLHYKLLKYDQSYGYNVLSAWRRTNNGTI